MGGVPLKLPPLREINHEIHLIDPNKTYPQRKPTCPHVLLPDLREKVSRYKEAGWWVETTASNAPPLMCIRKKDGKLRTVVDARARNDNTVKDVTPLPDQELI